MPESYPGAPGAPNYYGGYGYGGHNHDDKDGKDGKDGKTSGHRGYGGYGGYGRYGRRYNWDDRGEVSRYGASEIKNKDWWNYLTKDNGESGMVPLMLNRTQLEAEGMYDAIWWEEHGLKDA